MHRQVIAALVIAPVENIEALRRSPVTFAFLMADGIAAKGNRILTQHLSVAVELQDAFLLVHHDTISEISGGG
ncbi:hypothetical protein D3C71_2158940 [compost metagenome]